jgi:hypothetical protein
MGYLTTSRGAGKAEAELLEEQEQEQNPLKGKVKQQPSDRRLESHVGQDGDFFFLFPPRSITLNTFFFFA